MGQGASREVYLKAIDTLQQQSVGQDDELWQVVLTQTLDEDTVITVIKSIRDHQPDNLSILVRKNKIIPSARSHSLPPSITPTTTTTNSQDNQESSSTSTTTTTAESTANSLPQPKLDETHLIPTSTTTTTTTTTGEIKDEASQPLQPLQQQDKTQPSLSNQVDSTPLAIKLMEVLLDLLFHPGYTLDAAAFQTPTAQLRELFPEQLPNELAWQAGFGAETVKSGAAKAYWLNRMAVLQCILACLSEQLYTNQEQSYNFRSKWLDWLTHTQDYYTETLLYSLINTFCTYDPVGWGVPYNHLMFADDQEPVAKLCIQILNVLISYDPPQPGTSPSQTTESPNKFINFLKNLKRTRDFGFFFTHFERILGLPLMASHTRLPHSTKKIELHQDLLITFWRMISINHDFLNFVTTNPSSPQFLVSLLQYMDEGRRSQTTHGLVQIGTFILLVLSGERDFAISLNKPFNGHIVIDIPKPSGYSDFLIIVMYRLLMDNNDKLETYLKISSSVKPMPSDQTPTDEKSSISEVDSQLQQMNLESSSSSSSTSHQNEPPKESQKSSTEHIHREEPPPLDTTPKQQQQQEEQKLSPREQQPQQQQQQQQVVDTVTQKQVWIPTDEWLQSVKKNLPLENILKVITNLSPQIQRLCTGSGSDEQKIMEYLKISTTVGLFPAAGPIMTRKYHANPITKSWFIAYMWLLYHAQSS
ncbi:UPF0663 family protein [Heterostelium album PN500]|uniref:UPF0663 family protein n=1 Tax=Heterostelium pallidum (strain ATCC 26659 / Pp 5 / PN500) TaxID=670386 RepID=D3BIY8_HETP5|nr:UPF0663 family protein [Heterostelium album PN500]EFA78762.1 UPF0663 family protein [Heterostelium album PN500]|eukprot:XP_020430886.1 UPF0663 family protein [Heterostelium album PN500]